MFIQSIHHTIQRYRTLQTSCISSLPILILMPHSACNCRCVMCDIWKGNKNQQQLRESDISGLLESLRKFNTGTVVMSGGEALLNPNFFRFCEILQKDGISLTLLSTGLTVKRNAANLVRWVNDIIVSLDGDEETHDAIRNIPGAFQSLKEGVHAIKSLEPGFRISARTVIHRLNFMRWSAIIEQAKGMGLDQISFLPADVSSQAFNREQPWDTDRQHEILLNQEELPELEKVIHQLSLDHAPDYDDGFIAESRAKIRKIYTYYAAFYGLNDYPYKKCNAPWVSAVIEADGTVRPCFFHQPMGNIRKDSLDNILNSEDAIRFRKELDIETNSTCIKCVCSLNLSPLA
jgi:Fe-coproporphyrin III synthase